MIRHIIKKDLIIFLDFCEQKNIYYSSKNRKRIFNNCLKHGDKCYMKIEKGSILALIIVYKSGDKRFVKLYSNNYNDTTHLFQYLNWQQLNNLYILAHKRDKHLIYFNRREQKLVISYAIKRAGFYILKDLENKYLLTNKRQINVNN